MDRYVTGAMIKRLREKDGLSQADLAEKLHISDKAVSKWETGKGLPDISLLELLAKVFRISVVELLNGLNIKNTNLSANMLRVHFYVCPVCGNVLYSVGEAQISCHGILLPPLSAEPEDEEHALTVERVEDEHFVISKHPMTKEHYISFIAGVTCDRVTLVKLYPEGNAEARFKIGDARQLFFYCNRDGLYQKKVK